MEPTPPARPRRLRDDDGRLVRGRKSRAQIRRAARELFAERGFDKTTLRAIAERAGMGASSIYRHIRSKEELLVEELAELQDRAWTRLRTSERVETTSAERIQRFLDVEHRLLAEDPDLTIIALRATTHPEARVAKRVLALQDRTTGLVAEILQAGRVRGEVDRGADLLAAARAVVFITSGARLAWANGLLDAEACRAQIAAAIEVLFRGVAVESAEPAAPRH